MHRSLEGHDWVMIGAPTPTAAGRWECARCQTRVLSTAVPKRNRKVLALNLTCDEVIAWRVMNQ